MIIIKKYNKSYEKSWNQFIEKSNNGTLFQTRQFLNYHINRTFNDFSLLIYHHKTLIAVLPGVKIIKNKTNFFHSHPGTSYGGFILQKKLNFKLINEIINAIDQYLIQKKFKKIFLINSPRLYWKQPHDVLDYLLQWNQYQIKELYISHATNIPCDIKIDKLLSKRKRRYIVNNEQLKNFTFQKIKTNIEFQKLYKLLEQTKQKFKTTPTHSIDELMKLCKLFPNNIAIYISKLNNEVVGGSVIFHTTKTTSLVFYNIVSEKMTEFQLSSLQLYQSIKVCKQRGSEIFDLGVSQTPEKSNPLDPKFSLIQFKEQFGAQGFLRIAYEKEYK
tara:strand:- start:1972 stop:2961 length:990 start_codon:yes stop_codon:yes gene_type:complete